MMLRVHVCAVVPALVLALVFTSIVAPTVYASNASSVLSSQWNFVWYQKMVKGALTGYINECSVESGYPTHDAWGSTTSDSIDKAAFGYDATFVITFYEGHGDNTTGDDGKAHYVIANDAGGLVWDNESFYSNTFGRSHFAFLWSCEQGDVIGQMYSSGDPYGMPFAWTHKDSNTLSPDGYTNPYPTGFAFISFNGAGPTLDYDYCQGYYFAAYFYQCAFEANYTLNNALDYAAYQVWYCSYSLCPYRTGFVLDGSPGKMVIYGDGALQIGYASALPQPPLPPQLGGGKPGNPN